MKTFTIAGCGHLGKIVAKAYKDGLLGGYRLAAAYSRKKADAEELVSGTDAEGQCDQVFNAVQVFSQEIGRFALT